MQRLSKTCAGGMAAALIGAGPLLAASCWDIVQVFTDIPVPCQAQDIGQPCNTCPLGLWTLVDGTSCAEPYSILPPTSVSCLGGFIQASQMGCFCNTNPNNPTLVTNSPIGCNRGCSSSEPGGPDS